MLEKLRELANPYDFANPVSEERSFYGRSTETADVIYYLNHAKNTQKPIHIALVGARASGKTSFLNMAEIEARRRDFCCVRINLNEGDVQTDLNFFRKLFNAIVMAAFSAGAYGGRKGKTFFSYLDLYARGEVEDIEQIPFMCAILIARAVKGGNVNFNVPDETLSEDLTAIYAEIKKPILILVDECNVLRENRIILEKLRNIFMNMSGYMLMFAATEDFFPVMDEVFSPIMRQFKRIDIGPFKGHDDVRQCIRKPLERLSLPEKDVRDLAPSAFMMEVEALSGRKPYEIQLICHELYKRCQEGRSRRFSLNLNTLESIQEVIARGQNIDDRPLLKAAKRMKSNLFLILDAACGGTENLSLEDTWRVEFLFNGNERWNREQYIRHCQELQDMGIIRIEPNGVVFCGDQFDRIYMKYLARSKGARILLAGLSIDGHMLTRFADISQQYEGFQPISAATSELGAQDVSPVINLIEGGKLDSGWDFNPLVESILMNIMYQDAGSRVRLIEIRFRSDIVNGQAWFLWQQPEHAAGLRKLRKDIDGLRRRAEQVDFEIATSHWDLSVLSPDEICDRVQSIGDEHIATRVANELMEMVQHYYIQRKDKQHAMDVAKAAYRLQQSRLHSNANNVGYLYMDHGDYPEARLWLQAAIQYGDETDMQLVLYNSGILHSIVGEYEAANFDFQRAKQEKECSAACAYRLAVDAQGYLVTSEVLEPTSLLNLIDEAIEALGQRAPIPRPVHSGQRLLH
ncbi:hypothetical protein [Rhizobium sp. YS-1r]|uniref:hypothetical protein n=1 Tax=Rhizobium sp. YS-1r TaxID=1532558 RepID=UPI00050F8E30|nr:hypothetical protein [Rhizobium sp. YS-1r]KGE00976.1 hypothetical protein JL39_07460 [Rhizobium sp. YS-1r]